MVILKNAFIDGQMDFSKGVDTYRAPARVPRNQLCLSVNGTTRQDYLGNRPGWERNILSFSDANVQSAFETGRFQGFHGFVPDTGSAHLIFSISGKLYRVDALTGNAVSALTMPAVRSYKLPQAWFEQAENFLICQDNQSIPLIYDGASLRLSDVNGSGGPDKNGVPLKEVPVGNVMAYSGGRLWVALPDGRNFVAGDLVYGPTGTPAYNNRDSFLRFTENQYLNGGQPFSVPASMGPIRAMRAIANLDTSLGQGPLQVFTPSGCFSVDAPYDRALWALMTTPIKTVSLLDAGSLSQWATQLVNGDVWYRAMDGVRSFLIARRDFGTWGNRSMSYEVIRHLKDDDKNLLQFASAALFDNRLILTCAPQRSACHGVFHRGLVVLDFIPLTSMAGSEPPCWDGLWTGLDTLQVVRLESQGVEHCFAAVLAPEDIGGVRRINLWHLTTSSGHDTNGTTTTRISRAVESPAFDFSISGSNRLEQKLLEAADLWTDKVSGTVDFYLSFKPDEYPCWIPWKHWQICAKTERCATDAVDGCQTKGLNLKPQFRARMGALRPPDSTLVFINTPARCGYTFRYRLEIVGECELTAIRLLATRLVEQTFGTSLGEEASCEEIVCCEPELVEDEREDEECPDYGSYGGGDPGYSHYGYSYDSYDSYGGTPPDGGDGNVPPDGNFPVLTDDILREWAGVMISDYAFTKTGSVPADDLNAPTTSFWQTLETKHFADFVSTNHISYTEKMFVWDYVDSHDTYYGDIVAKMATGDSTPDGLPTAEFVNFWRLNTVYR